MHRTSAGAAHIFGILAQPCENAGAGADSVPGGLVRQLPPLPVPCEKRVGRAACRWAALMSSNDDKSFLSRHRPGLQYISL